jgi:hypothetical protein
MSREGGAEDIGYLLLLRNGLKFYTVDSITAEFVESGTGGFDDKIRFRAFLVFDAFYRPDEGFAQFWEFLLPCLPGG